MTDLELINAASKASGFEYTHSYNPLASDELALRLAVELNITIVGVISISNEDFASAEYSYHEFVERITNCKMTAIRRAIVRAAAEIGKAMP